MIFSSMDSHAGQFVIRGGRALTGDVSVFGAKNAASKMMIASLLTDEPCVLENVPLSQEIDITREFCGRIGSEIAIGMDHRCEIRTPKILNTSVVEFSRKNRIPVLAFGPLLHRAGHAEVPFLGGDAIGHRPIDLHLEALNKMGVTIERRERSYYATAASITGADIEFPFPSVGATENVLLTAVRARGTTTIRNAAVEPEILDLIRMLRGMGADIVCDPGLRAITIRGVARLGGVAHRVLPDRNEAVSFAVAGLATRGRVRIAGARADDLAAFVEKVEAMGAVVSREPDALVFAGAESYRAADVATAPHPGFMTDWQQPLAILMIAARGVSTIHETVYEDRFGYVKDLRRMGADIEITDECIGAPCRFAGRTFNHSARITGPSVLKGADIAMTDIRAGMAHVIAALAAHGESVISGIEHIDRGYERMDERLRALGADIKRV